MTSGLLGAVLAGGAGTRFGGDKAEATVGDTTMLERAVATAGEVLDRVVIVGRDAPGGTDSIPDRRPGEGPMAGLEVALAEARREGRDGVLLLGCDLPLLTADVLRTVAGALGEGDTIVAPLRGGGPPPTGGAGAARAIEPLCAAYSVALADTVSEHLDAGDRSLHALFDAVGGRALELPDVAARGAFTNVNTRADHARVVERVAQSPEVET